MDLSSLDSHDVGVNLNRFDGVSLSQFAEDALLQISTKNYERRYPELQAKSLIPIDTDINPGATQWGYDTEDHRGEVKFFGGRATDVPSVEVSQERHAFPVHPFWSSYRYTVLELLAARNANMPLTDRRAAALRREMAVFEDDILLLGEDKLKIPGFLRNAAVPLLAVATGGWMTGATASQIVADFNMIVDRPWIGTRRMHAVDTVLLPPSLMRVLETMPMANQTMTVLQFLKSTNPKIKNWEMVDALETAGTNGGRRIVAYQRDADVVIGVVPQPYNELDPQMAGIEVVVAAWQSVGGAVFRAPRSAVYAEGM